jgi:peptidoglycan lytic transglycosylase D
MVRKLYPLIALSFAVVLATTACQSSHRSANLLPAAQATAPPLTAATKPAEPANAAPASTQDVTSDAKVKPAVDPVAQLISRVEKEYQAGQDSTQAGQQDAAKEQFDRAFNLLMDSKLDVQGDPRLKAEYDKVLAGVNSVEEQALQQSGGPDDQKSEPAPIDEVNETTPAVDPNVKAKAEVEVKATHSDLPLMLTDPVAGYINYFSTRGRGTLERALARSGRYQEMIQEVLKEEGVPQDLMYLAEAESGFHPLALSRVGARGMWQLMASRAKGYGLQRNLWLDERQDPEKSTRAAARHLKDLYKEFGDWYLAMAAYNSGPGTVQQAVRRTGYADFWELYKRNVLPKETKNYVPIILAVTIMAKNPAQYGLEDVNLDEPLAYDSVKIDYPVDLRLVAQCIDVPVSTIQDLNPSLLRWSTPKDGTFVLHIPQGTEDQYLQTIATVPQNMRIWWRIHDVKPGDTLPSVAREYRVSKEAIIKANHLDSSELSDDAKLVIPIAPGRYSGREGLSYARRITRYHVHRGDTVQSVANNFGVPAIMIRRWNHLRGDSVGGRRILYVHLPVTPTPAPERVASSSSREHYKSNKNNTLAKNYEPQNSVVHHRVKPGETLYSIATTYNTTVSTLRHDNGIMDVAALRPGMVLVVHGGH